MIRFALRSVGSSVTFPSYAAPRGRPARGPRRPADRRGRRRPAAPRARRARRDRRALRRPSPGRPRQCMSQNPTTDRERRMRSPLRTVFGSRDAIPYVTSRPNGASAASDASKIAPPAISKTTSTGLPRFASTSRSVRPSAAPSIATSAPSSSASARLSSVDAVAMTRPAPIGRPSWTASEPTPPAAEWTTTLSPGATLRARPVEVPRREALHEQRERGRVVDAVGDRRTSGCSARSRTPRSRRRRTARRPARRCPRARPRPPSRGRAAAWPSRGTSSCAGACRRSSPRPARP